MEKTMAIVTLANGKEVGWEEFSGWTSHQQRMGLNPHAKKMNWGVTHSEKMRQIVKASYENGTRKTNWNFGGKNGMARALMTPAGEFATRKEAEKHYGVRADQMNDWIYKTRCNEFYYSKPLTDEERQKLRPGKKSVITPLGMFDSINSAAKQYGVSSRTIKTWIRTIRNDEFSYSK